MEDSELENRLKQSADGLEVKDFSQRLPDIQRIAEGGAGAESPVFVMQPSEAAAGGGSVTHRISHRMRMFIICAAFILATLFILAVVLPLRVGCSASNTGDGAVGTQTEAASSAEDNSAFYSDVTAAEFYSALADAADFTPYGGEYSLYYSGGSVAGGKVLFSYDGSEVTALLYVGEDGSITYAFDGLTAEQLQELTLALLG